MVEFNQHLSELEAALGKLRTLGTLAYWASQAIELPGPDWLGCSWLIINESENGLEAALELRVALESQQEQ